jgi:hypothetical protein
MRWDVGDGPPPGGTGGIVVYLDGAEQESVYGFDTAEGWVDTRCLDGHSGYPGEKHVDPNDPESCCNAPRRYGTVEATITRSRIERARWWVHYHWVRWRCRSALRAMRLLYGR